MALKEGIFVPFSDSCRFGVHLSLVVLSNSLHLQGVSVGAGQRQQLTAFGITTSFLDGDESESEDEAPRRSRHGQAKKRRRGFEGDNNEQRWDQAGTEQWEVPSGDADEANF